MSNAVRKRSWVLWLSFAVNLILLVICAAMGCYLYPEKPGRPPEGTGVAPGDPITALGRLEPRDGVVAVVGPTGDQIKEFCKKFHQGDPVKEDENLVELVSHAERKKEEVLAERQYEEAQAQANAIKKSREVHRKEASQQIADLEASKKRELALQTLKVAALEDQRDQARKEQRRVSSLPRDVVNISDQELEQQSLAVKKAEAEYRAARQTLDNIGASFDSQISLAQVKKDATEAEFALALSRVPLSSAKEQWNVARSRTELSILRSPVNGTIARLAGHKGDGTGLQPILHIATGPAMVAVCEVDERDIQRLVQWLGVKKPVPVTLTSSALNKPLTGKLMSPQDITGMLARNAILSFNPRADVDRRVVEVRVELDPESAKNAAGLLGLQVDAIFNKP